ncbi:hypothetical protein M427DRAFT_231031 [Gonapodya prolifera JEL478]|uniref:Uncharacterized protein n=1 Tax=Gonapodya prolifera (strain JEL478) TaxID=1344416 RepID=A0A138ZY47_GONPJ|nr:hypothetical protein M427DRAFT_231031 [Gonapodya prolifera JEL478]|eukprot:KXS09414.1 hypothetical protein M427DRAFT_231031 [Gonapodya prolifera JEL478]
MVTPPRGVRPWTPPLTKSRWGRSWIGWLIHGHHTDDEALDGSTDGRWCCVGNSLRQRSSDHPYFFFFWFFLGGWGMGEGLLSLLSWTRLSLECVEGIIARGS